MIVLTSFSASETRVCDDLIVHNIVKILIINNYMKKSIIKKLFIKLAKILGYEIIDQNNFISPTLDKKLNEDLSTYK